MLKELSLCYSMVYYYNGAHCTKVRAVLTGQSTVSGFDLAGIAVFFRVPLCLQSSWLSTWLTNHHPSVL